MKELKEKVFYRDMKLSLIMIGSMLLTCGVIGLFVYFIAKLIQLKRGDKIERLALVRKRS